MKLSDIRLVDTPAGQKSTEGWLVKYWDVPGGAKVHRGVLTGQYLFNGEKWEAGIRPPAGHLEIVSVDQIEIGFTA